MFQSRPRQTTTKKGKEMCKKRENVCGKKADRMSERERKKRPDVREKVCCRFAAENFAIFHPKSNSSRK